MDRYLAGEDIDLDTLIADLETAVARGSFYPVLGTAASPTAATARTELLELIVRGLPVAAASTRCRRSRAPDGEPRDPLACDPDGPLCAEVVKTTTDPYVGRISPRARVQRHAAPGRHRARVGPLRARARGHEDHDVDERVGALSSPARQDAAHVADAVAGDIVAVAKLTRAETGDTLSDKDAPAARWSRGSCPIRCCPSPIVAHTKADEDKLAQGLGRLVAEDPTMRLERNPETHQLVLWCMGEAHVDVLLDRLAQPLRRRRRLGAAAGVAARDVRRPAARATAATSSSPAATASSRCATSRSSRCRSGSGLRVRRQGRRRLGAAPVHPERREGRARPDGAGRRGRLPGGRHPGHARRRQGALGRLLRHGVPDRRRARAARGRRPAPASTCSSRSTRSTCSSPTSTSARS